MIEIPFVGIRGRIMQISQKRKNDQQDNLLEELLREKAAVLSRAGMAVDEAIEQLMRIDREIEVKISILNAFCWNNHTPEMLQKKQMVCEETNLSIDHFNAIRQKAQLQYYYLIVTREALGLRRHEMIQDIYRIPAKKEKIRTT
jgi:serine phosphatase RsbU (regulator of sigma subunit)